jgi:ADP-ribose pyrophosphatase
LRRATCRQLSPIARRFASTIARVAETIRRSTIVRATPILTYPRAMSDELSWRLGARVPAGDYTIFRTAFVEAFHPRTGAPKRFSLIECVDWVNVIALTPDDRVVLIRQYRPGTDTICLEIPGGMVDEGEDPAGAAARELEEETGYTARTWRRLGRVAPNPAIQNNHLHSFLALDAEPTSGQRLDGSEVISIETATLPEVQAMLRDGRIDHALVVDAFAYLALEVGELRRPAAR